MGVTPVVPVYLFTVQLMTSADAFTASLTEKKACAELAGDLLSMADQFCREYEPDAIIHASLWAPSRISVRLIPETKLSESWCRSPADSAQLPRSTGSRQKSGLLAPLFPEPEILKGTEF